MNQSNAIERLQQAVGPFFEQAGELNETKREKFAVFAGVGQKTAKKAFPRVQWLAMQHEWMLGRLRIVMDEIFQNANVREDFMIKEILKRIKIDAGVFRRIAGQDWSERAAKLQKTWEKAHETILAKLDEMVKANVPVAEITAERLFEAAGVRQAGTWLYAHLRRARRELAAKQSTQVVEPPPGIDAYIYPGGYLDLNSLVWEFKTKHSHFNFRRDRLRADVAEIAWPLLKSELRAGRLTPNTVESHYCGFIWAGELLGTEVLDVRTASLEVVQRAWTSRSGGRTKQAKTKGALVQLFAALFTFAETDSTINRADMRDIAIWLSLKAKLARDDSVKDYLSEEELDEFIRCCLIDIEAGMEFMVDHPNLLEMTTQPHVLENAAPVVHWATALMILILVFTGLRNQSIVGLRVKRWMSTNQPQVIAIAWHHTKKEEDSVAVTPALIGRFLDCYVRATEKVRQAINTNLVFLTSNGRGDWTVLPNSAALNGRLSDFVRRHGMIRDEAPLAVNATMLRRSYATHQLYKGRALSFVQAQLGHTNSRTTERYTQFSRYEHPGQVRSSLDKWGEESLDLWKHPVELETLDDRARTMLFISGKVFDADVDTTAQGNLEPHDELSPCGTCENLMVGAESIDEWESELTLREQRIMGFEADPKSVHKLVQERSDFELFKENHRRVKEGANK